MTTLLNHITTRVEIQGNHATIQYVNVNPEAQTASIQEDIAIAKRKTIQAVLPNAQIQELNRYGINPLEQTQHVLLNELHVELDTQLIKLIHSLHKPKQPNRFKKFLYWLTQSKPLYHITTPQELYSHILHNCYYQRLFIITPPQFCHIFQNHPAFISSQSTTNNHIYSIGHILGNPILVNPYAISDQIMSGALPNNIYSSQSKPEFTVEELPHNNQTKIKLETKTILHHIPQPLNRFYHFNATTQPKPLYKKLLKL